MSKDKEEDLKKPTVKKRPYEKPEVESEELLTFGALCNGSASGGRKASTGGPNFCNSKKLTS
ncbi:MAG: hypothetical protein CME70_15705 [Halobacteriovorax sp.]|nr:hypothetical protein [Halobacteriovorax sp.]|tara:strand:- start:4938 stop:5123 length:186 start_codon:yes stop_codon:yes gene_type:complete